MKFSILSSLTVIFAILFSAFAEDETRQLHICESEDPLFLGSYSVGADKMDGAPIYTNDQDMSFFRNRGFWYLGNLAPWPPETHYRCVEVDGCNPNEDFPPSKDEGLWTASKRFGKESIPVIQKEPCGNAISNDEL